MLYICSRNNNNKTQIKTQKRMRGILSFAALAAMYFPGCTTSKNAVHCLSRWIKGCNPLVKELIPTGYLPYNHRFLTSKQYKIITKHLGDPYEDQGISSPEMSKRLQTFTEFAAFLLHKFKKKRFERRIGVFNKLGNRF